MKNALGKSVTATFVGFVMACATIQGVAAADKVINITVPAHIPPSYDDMFPPLKRFVDRVNENGKGKVHIDLYPSESLYKVKDIVPALMNGSCEIVFHTSSHTTGSWQELGGLNLPFLYKSNDDINERWRQGGTVLNVVNKELTSKYGVRVLGSGITGSLWLHTIEGKPVRKPADLKGLKIRTTGQIDAEFIKAAGGSPIFLSSAETYEALQRGTIDGVVTFPGGIVGRNLDEVLRYSFDIKAGWAYQIYVLDKTFKSWPQDVQDIITASAKQYDEEMFKSMMDFEKSTVFPRMAKRMEIVQLDAEATKQFIELGAKVNALWIKRVNPNFARDFLESSQK